METLRALVANLGSPGAVRNAEDALAARREQDRSVEILAARLASVDLADVVTPAA
jgi:hypothetical protein